MIHPVNIAGIRFFDGQLEQFLVAQQSGVPGSRRPLAIDDVLDALQLGAANGCLEVREPIVEAEVGVHEFVVLAEGQALQGPCPLGQLGVFEGQHATLTRGEDLICVEAETPDVTDAAHLPALVERPVRFGGILDHRNTMALPNRQQAIHAAKVPV